LDHRVFEFAWRLPLSMKVRKEERKYLLRRVLYRYVPRELIDRPKMGFGVPVDHWFRNELHDMTRDVLLDQTARQRGIFRPEAVEQLIDEHQSQKFDHAYRLWALLFLELWQREWVDC
ncbi:MAG: asparagine synthase-related protein, partial [Pirellulaceae bacterium]|nr:asparagine synthase-related protein [Pirellulaceae bacterium]